MMGGILEGLLVAWILTYFNIDDICIDLLQPFFRTVELTTEHYYLVFGSIGLIAGAIYDAVH